MLASRRHFLLGRFVQADAHGIEISSACIATQGSFCGICSEVCTPRAITLEPGLHGMAVPRVDAAACNGCAECMRKCPANAIVRRPAAEARVAA